MNQRHYWYGHEIIRLEPNQIFVYGANPEFRNGAGGALSAQAFGAKKFGGGRGIVGQTFGLITKNLVAGYKEKATGIVYEKSGYRSVSPDQIRENIKELYECARNNPDKRFLVTYKNETWPNGSPKKSLNGYTSKEMLNIFFDNMDVPKNMVFHESFKPMIEQKLLAKEKLEEKKQNPMESSQEKIEGMKKATNQYNEAKKSGTLIITNTETNEKFVPFFKSTNIFSQWHPSKFEYKNRTFISCEQFMMYSKAKLFDDEDIAFQIMDINNGITMAKNFISGDITREEIISDKEMIEKWDQIQHDIKKLGKKVKNFNQEVWDSKNISIVSVASREKYSQNLLLKDYLLGTYNAILVEASPYDKIWGAGIGKEHPDILNPSKWKGKNLLGKILENTRTKFKLELQPDKKEIKKSRRP